MRRGGAEARRRGGAEARQEGSCTSQFCPAYFSALLQRTSRFLTTVLVGSYYSGVRVWPGSPSPLGATWNGAGVNFALFSEHATSVQLCLFPAADATMEHVCVPLGWRTDRIWHAYLPDARPGMFYGSRVFGPWDPSRGHRFNPSKILLDPYARIIGRPLTWHPSLFGYAPGSNGDGAPEATDRAPYAPLGDAGAPAFTW